MLGYGTVPLQCIGRRVVSLQEGFHSIERQRVFLPVLYIVRGWKTAFYYFYHFYLWHLKCDILLLAPNTKRKRNTNENDKRSDQSSVLLVGTSCFKPQLPLNIRRRDEYSQLCQFDTRVDAAHDFRQYLESLEFYVFLFGNLWVCVRKFDFVICSF